MSKFKLSKRSLKRLVKIHPKLLAIVHDAIENDELDFMVVEGLRTKEQQRIYVAKGVSKTMKSKHLMQSDGYSHAVDLAPIVNGKIPWNDLDAFKKLSEIIKQSAKALNINIEWGGDWKSFYDGPHYQLKI